MGDPLGSSARVSSQKQNHKGVVGAQSGQYRATAESRLGCDRMVSEPIPGRKCADEDVNIPHRPREWILNKTVRAWSGPKANNIVLRQSRAREVVSLRPGCDKLHEAFWELTSFGVHQNSKVKQVARVSNPMIGDPLGSSRVSSQKQNREGVVRAQSGQNRATVMERAQDVVVPEPGCDNLVSEPIPSRKCADEDVGPLKGWIVTSHIAQGSGSYKPYMYIPTSN
ncbi:hypothetical protein FF1_008913 [Malus domestica]